MGRISINVNDLIDDYQKVQRNAGRAAAHVANEGRKRWCDLRSQFPGWVERLPGAGFSAGFHDEICRDRGDRPSPTSEPPSGSWRRNPGSGYGHCQGQQYTVTVNATIEQPWSTYEKQATFSGPGPIQNVEVQWNESNPKPDIEGVGLGPVFHVTWGDGTTVNHSFGTFGEEVLSYSGTYDISQDQCEVPDPPPKPPQTPKPPPPPPYWPKPTGGPYGGGPDLPPVPTLPPIPSLPSPPDFPDFPKPEINVNFNIDNRRIEGPDFDIDIGGPEININWDNRNPPKIFFPDPDVPKPVPRPPEGPIVRPPGGGPGLPSLPWEIIIGEIIGEVLPDGSNWSDWLDIATDIIDTLSELDGEDGVKVEATNIPYYDCDSEEFKNLVWKVKQGDASAEDLNILSQAAQQAKLWCDEPHIVTGIPEWWARRQGANVPQLVVTFRRGDTSSYVSLQIPHYKNEPERGETPIGEYQAGDFMARETLVDNSKVVVNASDENEAERVLDQMCEWVQPAMRSTPPQRQFTRRQGQGISQLTRWPRKVEIFPQGRYSMAGPSKAWRLPIEGQQS